MDFDFCDTIIGRIGVIGKGKSIIRVLFDFEIPKNAERRKSPVICDAVQQLLAYFDKRLQKFLVLLLPVGTEFMKKVWDALLDIPYGATVSYKYIACVICSPKAWRAIGKANGSNRIPIFIPCHRVIKSNGSIGGFAGKVDKKRTLIVLESGKLL